MRQPRAMKPESMLRKDARSAEHPNVTFQHRHFAFLAGVIAENEHGFLPLTRAAIARAFADALATTNPRFDRARFLRACGVES